MNKFINFLILIIFSALVYNCVLLISNFENYKNSYAFYIYFIPSFLFLFLIVISFFLDKEKRKVISIILVSIFSTLFIFEIFLFFLEKNIISSRNIPKQNLKEIVLNKRDLGEVIWLPIFPRSFINVRNKNFLPLSGISNKETLLCIDHEGPIIYKSDRYGFRNEDSVWDNEIEIILLGDSFVHGSCKKDSDIFPGIIKDRFNKTLNLGIGSTGPLLQFAILKEYGKNIKPKKIFWFFYENDLKDLEFEFKDSNLTKYFYNDNFSQKLVNNEKDFNNLKKELSHKILFDKSENDMFIKNQFKNLTNEIKKILKLTRLRTKFSLVYGWQKSKSSKYLEDIYMKSKKIVSEWGGEIVIVYLPGFPSVKNDFEFKGRKVFFDAIEKNNIEVIDLLPVFKKSDDPKQLFGDHYTKLGNNLVAEKIIEFINSNTKKSY